LLNYTSLFADLEQHFQNAGRDAASFRQLQRKVARASVDLREYYEEVAHDYVIRVEQRLSTHPEAALTQEEASLLRGFLGIPLLDAEREQQLLSDLERLEESMQSLLRLKGAPLSLRNLDALRRLLDRLETLLPKLVEALSDRERASRFDEALGDLGATLDRAWLAAELRRALEGSGAGALASDESGF
jgi:hypothetical protein